jgi:hypothetical protein
VEEFCIHFKPDINKRIVYFLSALIWWLERIHQPFLLELLEEFLCKGFQQEVKARKLEYFHEDKDMKLYQLLLITMC